MDKGRGVSIRDGSIKIGVLLRKQGYCGVVSVFYRGLHVWSEVTPHVRTAMADALGDARLRRGELVDEGEPNRQPGRLISREVKA